MIESPLAISAFPAAASASNGDVGLFTQGSTGPGTGITRKVSLAQMLAGGTFTATNTTTLRTLADRAADWVNAKDFGAKVNGTTSDTAAVAAAYAATGNQGSIFVPAGGWNSANPTPTTGKFVLWKLTGNSFGTGTTPVAGIGTDTVETFLNGARFYSRTATAPNAGSVLRVDSTATQTSGTPGPVSTVTVNTTATAAAAGNFAWGITSVLNSASTSGLQNVAIAGYAHRTAAAAGVGDEIWATNLYADDLTGLKSSLGGAVVTAELDIRADNDDDGGVPSALLPAGGGTRVGIDLIGSQRGINTAGPAIFGYMVRVGAHSQGNQPIGPWDTTQAYAKRVFTAVGGFSIAAYDASLATAIGTANAFRMGADQTFAFDGLTNTRTLGYVSADTALEYKKSGTTLWSVSDAGAATIAGSLIRKAATADQSADVYAATAAGSRTIPNGCSWEALTPAATIATFTTTMPAAPIDKQEVWISTTQTITTWTLSANTGQTINGAPKTLLANTAVMFRYNLATTTWMMLTDYSLNTINVKSFGAKCNGSTDDSAAVQNAVNYCAANQISLYIPGRCLLNTPLNLTGVNQILIYGDGCDPYPGPSVPSTGSVLVGNTGGTIIDAVGGMGIVIRDITISSIGQSNPSVVGIIMSNSVANPAGGYSCTLQNVTIALPTTGTSCPFYGVNVNLLSLLKVNTLGDFGIVLAGSNILSISPPFGTYGANVQSDAVYSQNCFLNGYGPQPPFILDNSNDGTHDQLYIHANNIGAGFTGSQYAMHITQCNDLAIKVEIDGFPCALLQDGVLTDADITGIIFQGGTPVAAGQSFIAELNGTQLNNCNFGIRGITTQASRYHYTTNATPTMVRMIGCSFLYDTSISSDVASLDFTSGYSVPIFDCKFSGDQDSGSFIFSINGAGMTAAQYRYFLNGVRVGTA